MDEKQEKLVDTAATEQASSAVNAAVEPKVEGKIEAKADERRFSQEEVNEIVRDRLAKAKAKSDDELLKRLEALEKENKDIKVDSALTKAGISPDKREDVIFYMKGKGVEISEETLANELLRHPHWKGETAKIESKKEEIKAEEQKPSVSVRSVGSGSSVAPNNGNNDDKLRGLFRL